MNTKLFVTLAVFFLVAISGCTEEQPTETMENPTTEIELNDEVEPTETTPIIPEQTNEEIEPIITPTIEKLGKPYRCDDALILEKFELLGAEVLRKPAPFGKTINFVSCNVKQDGQIIMQFEIHELNNMEMALESMEDEARQYQNQIPDLTKTIENVGYKSYSFYSANTKENRFLFLGNDNRQKIIVKMKSTPGIIVNASIVKQAAEILAELI